MASGPPRPRLLALGLLAGLLPPACGAGSGGGSAVEIPLPADLGAFDPAIAEGVQRAAAGVRADAGDAAAWAALGMVYEANRLPELAVPCYEEAAELGRDPRWPHRRAVCLALLGEHAAALEAMSASIEREPGYAPSHARLGTWHLAAGDLGLAEEAFRRAASTDPGNPAGRTGLARVRLQEDDPEAAIELLRRVLEENPGDEIARQLLGAAYRAAGRPEEPEARLALDARADPPWPDPWDEEMKAYLAPTPLMRARRLAETGRYEEAVRLLEELRADPTDRVRVDSILAETHFMAGHADRALAVLRELVSLEPRNVKAYRNLARVQAASGAVDAAVSTLERALAIRPDDPALHADRGWILFEAGRVPESIGALARAFELDAGDHENALRLGLAGLALGRTEAAIPPLRAAARRIPPDPEACGALAKALLELERVEEARSTLERVGNVPSSASPRLAEARAEMARVAGER